MNQRTRSMKIDGLSFAKQGQITKAMGMADAIRCTVILDIMKSIKFGTPDDDQGCRESLEAANAIEKACLGN